MSKPSKLVHLLIPKMYRVYCVPGRAPSQMLITTKPSACTCANCLTIWRIKSGGRKSRVTIHTIKNYHQRPDYE